MLTLLLRVVWIHSAFEMDSLAKSAFCGIIFACGLITCPAFGQQSPVTDGGTTESATSGKDSTGKEPRDYGSQGTDDSPRATRVTAGWLTLGNLSNPAAATIEKTRRMLENMAGVEIIPANRLLRKLRRIDRNSNLTRLCSEELEKAKGLQLGMKLDEAAKLIEGVIERQRSGFVEYYDPSAAAAPYLQLGVVLVQSGHIEAAESAMRKALKLVPTLGLSEAWYSPKVRKVFERVRKLAAETRPELPEAAEAARLCKALELQALVVAVETSVGGQRVLQSALFLPPATGWDQIVTVPLTKVPAASRQLYRALKGRLEERFPTLIHSEDSARTTLPGRQKLDDLKMLQAPRPTPKAKMLPSKPPPPPEPWYSKYWWIWPVAAAVTATAIALPLTVFKREVIRIDVR